VGPVRLGELVHSAVTNDPGGTDQDVEPAKARFGEGDRALEILRSCYISGTRVDAIPGNGWQGSLVI
jgi:hypothetical protein